MIRQSTIDKLHEMRLSAMADAFENQCADAATYQNLSFEDRFGMLVDREWEKRKNSKLQKLIRNAGFRYPNASVEAIEYHPDRNLDKVYIPFQVNHVHGQTEPVPRRMRATLTETEPVLFDVNYQTTVC